MDATASSTPNAPPTLDLDPTLNMDMVSSCTCRAVCAAQARPNSPGRAAGQLAAQVVGRRTVVAEVAVPDRILVEAMCRAMYRSGSSKRFRQR